MCVKCVQCVLFNTFSTSPRQGGYRVVLRFVVNDKKLQPLMLRHTVIVGVCISREGVCSGSACFWF